GWHGLPGDRLGDQARGQVGLLTVGEHPADHVATVDVEDDVEVVVGPLGWAEQFGDVPAPDLIGGGRQQLRPGVGRMEELVTAGVVAPGSSQLRGDFDRGCGKYGARRKEGVRGYRRPRPGTYRGRD